MTMATRDVAAELGKSDAKPYVVGPVPDKETNVAQSLLDRHRNLASKPMDPALGGNVEQDEDRTHVIIHNRIHGTGALTPASLARELEAGIKMREAADTKSESTKAGGNGT
ncbi:hypothetical protein G6O67_005030 [Ophiocordyceps sinensis]|uniref:Uncharacterized protein n=1 Tax=Ophiocordyceps sinensis TaxID=72228 RepID=A0A8H4V5F2_9HYPO|nr:hypothetical protein G6O67_005030 [Ophiocordyceps sinensis]